MTVAEHVSQALLQAGGGIITPDLSIRQGEAKTYLALCVNYAMTGDYWLQSKSENERLVNPLLFMAFDNVPILYSPDHFRYYSTLPKRVVTISKGRAIEITTMCGKKCYPLNTGDAELQEFYGGFKDFPSYELEGTNRVWLWNLPKLVTGLRPRYAVHVNDLDDDDEVLLPSETEVTVVKMMVEFLTGQRKTDKDYVEDGKDK